MYYIILLKKSQDNLKYFSFFTDFLNGLPYIYNTTQGKGGALVVKISPSRQRALTAKQVEARLCHGGGREPCLPLTEGEIYFYSKLNYESVGDGASTARGHLIIYVSEIKKTKHNFLNFVPSKKIIWFGRSWAPSPTVIILLLHIDIV